MAKSKKQRTRQRSAQQDTPQRQNKQQRPDDDDDDGGDVDAGPTSNNDSSNGNSQAVVPPSNQNRIDGELFGPVTAAGTSQTNDNNNSITTTTTTTDTVSDIAIPPTPSESTTRDSEQTNGDPTPPAASNDTDAEPSDQPAAIEIPRVQCGHLASVNPNQVGRLVRKTFNSFENSAPCEVRIDQSIQLSMQCYRHHDRAIPYTLWGSAIQYSIVGSERENRKYLVLSSALDISCQISISNPQVVARLLISLRCDIDILIGFDRFAQRAVASRRRTTRITMRNELQWYVDMMSSERERDQASELT